MSPTEYHSRFRFQRLQYTDEELRVMDLEVQGADFISEDNEPIPGEPENPLHESTQKEYFDPIVTEPVPPMITAVVVAANEGVTVWFSAAVQIGAGGSGGFTLTVETPVAEGPGDLTFVALAPDGMSATFTTENKVEEGEVAHLAYLQPGAGIVGVESGLDMESAEGIGATNKASAPVIVSAVVEPDGATLTLKFSEPVVVGTDGWNFIVLSPEGGDTYPTYVSGSGTDTITLSIPSYTVYASAYQVTMIHSQPGDGIKDTAGNLLASVVEFPVTNNSVQVSPDVTAPTFVSATVEGDGVTLTLVFSEPVTAGGDGCNFFILNVPTGFGDTYPTYSGGLGTTTITLNIPPPVVLSADNTIVLHYSQPGDGLKDMAGNLLAEASDFPVTNNSVQS